MGQVSRFDLKAIRQQTGVSHFIETGTWYGESSNYALNSGYTVETCEINDKLHMIAKDRFSKREEVKLYQLPSAKFLPIAEEQAASVFFLDAHLPSLYVHHEEGIRFDDSIILPLENELHIIKNKQNFDRSIIIIDDARLYSDWYGRDGAPENLNSFNIQEWFAANSPQHDLYISFEDEGYIVAVPESYGKIKLTFSTIVQWAKAGVMDVRV